VFCTATLAFLFFVVTIIAVVLGMRKRKKKKQEKRDTSKHMVWCRGSHATYQAPAYLGTFSLPSRTLLCTSTGLSPSTVQPMDTAVPSTSITTAFRSLPMDLA
jgi:hypothetical protein